jgi:hypothetical protein
LFSGVFGIVDVAFFVGRAIDRDLEDSPELRSDLHTIQERLLQI